MSDIEKTPLSNVAFNGVVAEELTRLYQQLERADRTIKRLQTELDWYRTELKHYRGDR